MGRQVWALRGSIVNTRAPVQAIEPGLQSVRGYHFCTDEWTNLNGGLGIR